LVGLFGFGLVGGKGGETEVVGAGGVRVPWVALNLME